MFLYDLSHEQVTLNNVIRQEKVAEYDIEDGQDNLMNIKKNIIFRLSDC